ncbi:MAG: LysM repeat protein [Candidatus Binatia bacterium]|jgi:LysM repeat protein
MMSGFTFHTNTRIVFTTLLAVLFLGLAVVDAPAKTHVVRRGETLGGIASKHKVALTTLKRENSLRSNLIKTGQRLRIPEKAPAKKITIIPGQTHTVRKGESITEIAEKYGASPKNLAAWNKLKSASLINTGDKIRLTAPSAPTPAAAAPATHMVTKGETLNRIAEKYRVKLSTLARANKINWPYGIKIGQKITIPGGQTASTSNTAQPAKTTRIIVQKSQTLAEIARRYGVSKEQIAAYNGLKDPDRLLFGQRLIIPGKDASPKSPINTGLKAALDKISVRAGKWKYIVVHHSATKEGGWKGMDRYHRARGMENGLAYHFVIGRGGQMQNGSTYIGNRWKKQINGGHLAKESMNAKSIGICLVGDFTTQTPTSAQMRSLNGLTDYLLAKCRLKTDAVKTHRQIHPNHTACPGKRFPVTSFARELKKRN